MPAYDSNLFYPPAPMAKVSLKNPDKGNAVSDVPMLIDSGADITLIPQAYVDELKAENNSGESYEMQGFDGHRSLVKSVHLDLVFLARTFRGRFLIINSENGILGRDVLNHVAVLLDGPRLNWQEQLISAQ